MPVNEKKADNHSEDIDLLLLVERCILFFKKYRWVFFTCTLLGLLSGFYFYSIIPKTYKSRMIIHSFLLTNQEEIQIVKNWNELLKKKEYTTLKNTFHCKENILLKVKEIKGKEIQQVFSQTNPNGFIIDVLVTDNAVLDELEEGLVYGFENIPYIKKRLDFKKAAAKELIDKTSTEIQKLDSTKKRVEGIINGTQRSSSPIIIDGSSINRQLIEMNEKLLSFRENLEFTNAVQVFQSFVKIDKPDGPKLIPWFVIGLFVFLSIGYLFALISSINQAIKTRAKNLQEPKVTVG
jgi:hypothetical protein